MFVFFFIFLLVYYGFSVVAAVVIAVVVRVSKLGSERPSPFSQLHGFWLFRPHSWM